MAIALSSIGVKVSYCVETTAHSRPTTGYKVITGIKSTPDLNVSPATADTTTFDNKEYTTKIDLLKEMPDSLEFNAQFSQELYDNWTTLISAYDTGATASEAKSTWFCIDIPGLDKSIFFEGKPVKMGIPSMEANSAIETTLYIVPLGEPIYDSDPTYLS